MSRAFNGSTDLLTFSAGSAPPDQGPITIIALVKSANTAGFTGWFVRGRKSGTAVWSSLTSNNAGAKLFMENDFGNGVGGLTTNWSYYVVTKPSGSALPRWHTQNVTTGGAWVHTNGSANVTDGTGNIDSIVVGQSFPGSFAVVAAIDAEWTDSQVAARCTLNASDLFTALGGSGWMVRLNQASTSTSVSDDIGTGSQTAISGTTVDADDPPGYNYSISAGSTIAPSGIAVPISLGSHTLSQTLAVTPSGLAVPVALGSEAVSQALTVTPTGLAVPVALGSHTLSQGGISPSGKAVPVALGNPTLAQTFTSVPAGISIPVALGTPSLAQLAGSIAPTGLSISVSLGALTVAGQPYVPPAAAPGGWYGLMSALRQPSQPPVVACPNDGEPLRVSVDGIVFCPYDNFILSGGSSTGRAGASGGDWGGLRAVIAQQQSAAAVSFALQAVACPNDGEPLSVSEDGVTFCRFDGYRPDGGEMPPNAGR